MKVKVEMIIETDDFGVDEFRKEVENLIADIDDGSKLLEFSMFKVKPNQIEKELRRIAELTNTKNEL